MNWPRFKRAATTEDEVQPRRKEVVVLMMIVLLVIVTAAAGQIWTRLQVIDYGYKISKANREHTKLMEIHRRLKIELTLRKNPARIKKIATQSMGLVIPRPEQVRRIRLQPHQPALSQLERSPTETKDP